MYSVADNLNFDAINSIIGTDAKWNIHKLDNAYQGLFRLTNKLPASLIAIPADNGYTVNFPDARAAPPVLFF